jgi:hypothetical protein
MNQRDNAVVQLRVAITGEDLLSSREITLRGREAWALDQLVSAGNGGCTPITHPGPRWSDYVFKLKKRGLQIETRHEGHGGAFSGHHGRYVLRSPVRIIETIRQGDQRSGSSNGFSSLPALRNIGNHK